MAETASGAGNDEVARLVEQHRRDGLNMEAIKARLIESGHHDDAVESGVEHYLRRRGRKMMMVYAAVLLGIVALFVLFNVLN